MLPSHWVKAAQIHLSSPRDRDRAQRSSKQDERARHRASPRRRIATPRARSAFHVLHTRMAIRRREHRRVDIDSVDGARLRARREGDSGGRGDSGVAGKEDECEAWCGYRYGTYASRSVAWNRRYVQRARKPSVSLEVITEGLCVGSEKVATRKKKKSVLGLPR